MLRSCSAGKVPRPYAAGDCGSESDGRLGGKNSLIARRRTGRALVPVARSRPKARPPRNAASPDGSMKLCSKPCSKGWMRSRMRCGYDDKPSNIHLPPSRREWDTHTSFLTPSRGYQPRWRFMLSPMTWLGSSISSVASQLSAPSPPAGDLAPIPPSFAARNKHSSDSVLQQPGS